MIPNQEQAEVRAESKTRLVEQINVCQRLGDYSRALDLARSAAPEFPNDAELSQLEKCAEDGVKRKAEANRLITESQELFAQRKSVEAIQLLRKAYELDKNNSLARSILANALVEHASSIVDTDWLEAEKLTNQALSLIRTHPTAKSILNRIVERKTSSSVDDWVSQARKLQSSGDLFGALAWVAEGLAVHPHDSKLLQIQDEIQRDQDARRRQDRRRDLEDLRRLQHEIAGANDAAAKQALVERIQGIAAKHWTDGEILSIANALLLRLGLLPQDGSTASSRRKSAAVIFHVPQHGTPEISRADTNKPSSQPAVASSVETTQVPPISDSARSVVESQAQPKPDLLNPLAEIQASINPVTLSTVVENHVPPKVVSPERTAAASVTASEALRNIPARGKLRSTAPKQPISRPQPETVPATESSAPAPKVKTPPSQPKQVDRSSSTTLIAVSLAALVLIAATFFFTRKHYAPEPTTTSSAGPTPTAATHSPAAESSSVSPSPTSGSTGAPLEPSEPAPDLSPKDTGKVTLPDQPAVEPAHNLGSLLVVAGQDDARVSLNGKPQPQLTQAGQLRVPNLGLKEYVVQISKAGFQDPPAQKIRIRKDEEAKLIFNLQPQPGSASLNIQGGLLGTTVFVDQALIGTIQPDGALTVSTINPGDHTIELRKDRFKSRQFKRHFVAGAATSLAAADVTLEAAPSQLRITFTPADANVAIVKGDLLKMVSSGVPLNLAPGTYTLTARTTDRFTRSSTIEILAGQSKTVDLSLAPNGMTKWDDPGAWKQEGASFTKKGGDFVLYGALPTTGTFVFSAMPAKGHVLQWVLNYIDPKNYILFQMDENYFYRTVIRDGQKTSDIRVSDKGDKKSFRMINIRVTSTEIVHQVKHGDSWTVVDRWSQPGVNLGSGKFGFYIPGNDQVALSNFAHYADLSIR